MKGFYFSFDSLLALSVLTASLVMVSQYSDLQNTGFEANTVEYRSSGSVGRDAMKLGSQRTFQVFSPDYRQELVDQTVMVEEDMDRTVVDGLTLLWAARNSSYAREATKKYFGSRIPESYEYRLQVSESGNTSVLYRTSEMPEDASAVASTSRLVSGHKIDEPSEGFQARAQAVESQANQTKVVNIPMMGSGSTNQRLMLDKKFQVNASQIHSAKIYFSAHWGQSNFNSNTVELNGESLENIGGSSEGDWDYYAEKNGTTLGYDTADVTEEVRDGWNEFYLNFNNQNNHHVHIHPGTRIEVTYSGKGRMNSGKERRYFANVEGEAGNQNKRGGAWITKPFYIPEDATVNNVSTRLNVKNIRDVTGRSDLEVYLNQEKIYADNVSGDAFKTVDMTDEAELGNNVLSVYANTFVDDGKVTGFGGYPENPTIYSDPQNDPENSSSLYLDYDSPDSGLLYNKIEVVTSEEIGGSAENPKEFSESFRDDVELSSVFLNLAQLDSRDVTVEAGSSYSEEIFSSPREFATPTKIGVSESLIDTGTNDFRISDECSISCSILPETSVERHVFVPSQVGYGGLYANRSAAVSDARERLREQLGEYADATQIENEALSTGSQPYIWGPASMKLVVWNE